MILYCVESPWHGDNTPDQYPGCFQWVTNEQKARKLARQAAEVDTTYWADFFTHEVKVWRVKVPDHLTPKRRVLWMARNAAVPVGEVIHTVALVRDETDETED